MWVKLKTYKQGDDGALFDLYHGPYNSNEVVRSMVARARATFLSCPDPVLVLCVNHNKWILTNKRMNDAKAPDDATRICCMEDSRDDATST